MPPKPCWALTGLDVLRNEQNAVGLNAIIDAHRKAVTAEFGLIVELDALGIEGSGWWRIAAHGIEKEIEVCLAGAIAGGVRLDREVAVARLPLGELGVGDGKKRLGIGSRLGRGNGPLNIGVQHFVE